MDPIVHTGRRIYDPIQKDYATFLKTAEETGGESTLIEVELAPGGGNDLHYHRSFSERFEVIEGELLVQAGSQSVTLREGQSITAPPNTLHRFANPGTATTRFFAELRPGRTGFENTLRIAYGLSRDGRVDRKGIPKNIYHMAVLVQLADSNVPGLFSLAAPLLRLLARSRRGRSVERELLEQYCPPLADARPAP
jgi:quercetin dioxygenase-like cupin family protein